MTFLKASKREADVVKQSPAKESAVDKGKSVASGGEDMEVGLAAFEAVRAADEKERAAAVAAEKPGRRNRKKWVLLVVLLLAISAIAVALSVTLTEKKDVEETEPTEDGPEELDAESEEFGALLEILKPHTPEETLRDPTTPQGQAFLQLVDEYSEPVDQFRVLQRYALMTLYFSTTPGGWSVQNGWDGFSSKECDWFGVSACRPLVFHDAVSNLELASNNLAGTIPSELCLLGANLELLDMGNNFLTGSIPQCFAQFEVLNHIELDDNSLTGPLPRGLLKIPSLEIVELYRNQLDGGLDVLLESDDLSNTRASGLRFLKLDRNKFSGQIPADLFSFAALEILFLADNDLEGAIGSDVCDLSDAEGGVPDVFTFDCGEVTCDCCGACS